MLYVRIVREQGLVPQLRSRLVTEEQLDLLAIARHALRAGRGTVSTALNAILQPCRASSDFPFVSGSAKNSHTPPTSVTAPYLPSLCVCVCMLCVRAFCVRFVCVCAYVRACVRARTCGRRAGVRARACACVCVRGAGWAVGDIQKAPSGWRSGQVLFVESAFPISRKVAATM